MNEWHDHAVLHDDGWITWRVEEGVRGAIALPRGDVIIGWTHKPRGPSVQRGDSR